MRGSRCHRFAGASEAGFSLLELLIGSVVSTLVLIGVGTMLTSIQENAADSQARIDTQQEARMALMRVQRDLQIAGVGLASLQPPFATILPRADGGIDIRINPDKITTFLTDGQSSGSDALEVNSTDGFEIGQTIAVYDPSGSVDLATVTGINGDEIQHTGLTQAYTQPGSTAVTVVRTVTYRLTGDAAPFQLVREVDGTNAAILANEVVAFDLVYFDDSQPPLAFTPTTTVERMRIRLVEVEVEVRTAVDMLTTNERPSLLLTARIAPRSLTLF